MTLNLKLQAISTFVIMLCSFNNRIVEYILYTKIELIDNSTIMGLDILLTILQFTIIWVIYLILTLNYWSEEETLISYPHTTFKSKLVNTITKFDILLWSILITISLPRIFWGLKIGYSEGFWTTVWAYNRDEFVESKLIIDMIQNGSMAVDHYYYPSLHRYLIWFIITPLYLLKFVVGIDYFFFLTVLITRLLSLIFGCLLLTYLRKLTQMYFGSKTAIIVTFALLSTYIYPRMAVDSKPDLMMLCLLLVGFYYSIRSVKFKNKEDLRLGWIFTALASTTKYNAMVAGVIPLFATFLLLKVENEPLKQQLRQNKYLDNIKESAAYGVLFTPAILFDPINFWGHIGWELLHQGRGHYGIGSGSPSQWYTKSFLMFRHDIFLYAICGFAIFILLSLLIRSWSNILVPLSSIIFIILYGGALSLSSVGFSLYLLPLVPFIAVGVGLIHGTHILFNSTKLSKIFDLYFVIQLVLIVVLLIGNIASFHNYPDDTRDEIETSIYQHTNFENYDNPKIAISNYVYISAEISKISEVRFLNGTVTDEITDGVYTPQLIILSSIQYGRIVTQDVNNSYVNLFKDLIYNRSDTYSLVHEIIPEKITNNYETSIFQDFKEYFRSIIVNIKHIFSQNDRNEIGPTIKIYELNDWNV